MIISTSNALTLEFTSDSEVTAKGFRAKFTIIDGKEKMITEEPLFSPRKFHSAAYDSVLDVSFFYLKKIIKKMV